MGWTVDTEQRQSRRVCVELPIRFTVLGGTLHEADRYLHACTCNVSAWGASFVTALAMPINCTVRMMMSIPGFDEEVQAEGTVVRIFADRPEHDGIEYGVQFTRVNPQEVLDRFVRSIDLLPLLKLMVKQDATDLHLSVNAPPLVRIDGRLLPASEKMLSSEAVESLVSGLLSPAQRAELRARRETHFPYTVPGVGRWRVGVFYQRGFIEAAIHTISQEIPSLDQLGLPETLRDLVRGEGGGLVLVTGSDSSGKQGTLAALLEAVNQERTATILTLENPVQYVFSNRRSVVRQREVGSDAPSFAEGLRSALLQDADVIALSEIPDPETAESLLRAAESGRLILATMPTTDAVQTIERLVAWLPAAQRTAALYILSIHLRGIVSQCRLPRADGHGTALAIEIMVPHEGIRAAIRTDKLDQVASLMRSAPGAHPLDASLRALVLRRMVDLEVAAGYSSDPDRLRKAVLDSRV